ncbi:MAG: OmpA family protein [Bacteroidota bacterium]
MKKCILVICTLFTLPLFAQRAATDYGDLYYEFFQFKEAAKYYEQALNSKRVKNTQYLHEQLSQCYKYLFQYKRAEEYFEEVMKHEKIQPEFYIDYGNILKLNGKYADAKLQFEKYQKVTGSDIVESNIRSVNWAIQYADTVKNYAVFQTDLNINGQSLGYCFYDDGLIYAHARNKKQIGKDMSPLFDLDYARNINNTEFKADVEMLALIKFDLNEGSPCISPDKNTLYFSANSTNLKKKSKKSGGEVEVSDEGVANFKIYAAGTEGGYFQNPEPLSFNNNEYNCIHPFMMEDGITLLFSSNMPGGYGGFDLYKSVKQGEVWSKPFNLGNTVNTSENELFPWVSESMLYFSSKGFNNYGGYDIYIARMDRNTGELSTLKNLGQPINSFRDDVAFITKDGGRTGYFSSNRGNDDGDDYVYYFRETIVAAPVPVATTTSPTPSIPKSSSVTPPVKVVSPIPSPTVIPPPPASTVIAKKNSPKAKTPTSQPQQATNSNAPETVSPKPVTHVATTAISTDVSKLLQTQFKSVLFRFNDAEISAPLMEAADSIARILNGNNTLKVYITGHTDSRGSFSYNIALSNKRAASLKRYLLNKGVAATKIITRGLGESRLVNECEDNVLCSDEQHALNRRVEMRLVQ